MPDDDIERRFRDALKRSIDSVGIDRGLIDRAAGRARVADLTFDGLAEAIDSQLKALRREILEHVHRQYEVLSLKIESKNPRDETRAKNSISACVNSNPTCAN
jgi:hypothetical protein